MRIGVDIDDVLADFVPSFITYVNSVKGTSFTKEQLYSYYIPVLLGGTAQQSKELIFDFYNDASFENISPLKHSQDAISTLSKKHKLTLITARPDFLKSKTLNWIQKHYQTAFSDIHFSYNHYSKYGKLKKYEICQKENINILIEDSPEYAKEVARLGKEAYLIDAPWNKTKSLPKNVKRVKTWKTILQELDI